MVTPAQTFQQFLTEFWNDTRPPDYSNVFVDQITPNAARANFTTSELSNSRVFISTSLSIVQAADINTLGGGTYPTGQWIGPGSFTILSQIALTGLADETTYYFRVWTEDAAGNRQLGQEAFSFATALDPPATISNILIDPSTLSAVFTFTTDEGTQARVRYGTVAGTYPNATTLDAPGTTSHTHTLLSLNHSTTYFYEIEATDSGANVSLKTGSFSTDADPLPIISNVNHSGLTRSAVTITWNTDEPCTSQVQYGTTSGSWPNATSEDLTLKTSHSVTITGLSTFTTYYYRVRVKDSVGQVVYSGQGSFTTIGNPTAIGFSSVNNGDGGSSSLSVPVPPGVTTNDWLFMAVAVHGDRTANTPSGWTLERTTTDSTERLYIFKRKYQSGDGAYGVTLSGSTRANAGIGGYRNVHQTTPVHANAEGSDNVTDLTVTCSGPGQSTYYFGACSVDADEGIGIVSGGFVERFEPRSTRNLLGCDKASSSSSETVHFDIGTSVDRHMCAIVLSMKPI